MNVLVEVEALLDIIDAAMQRGEISDCEIDAEDENELVVHTDKPFSAESIDAMKTLLGAESGVRFEVTHPSERRRR